MRNPQMSHYDPYRSHSNHQRFGNPNDGHSTCPSGKDCGTRAGQEKCQGYHRTSVHVQCTSEVFVLRPITGWQQTEFQKLQRCWPGLALLPQDSYRPREDQSLKAPGGGCELSGKRYSAKLGSDQRRLPTPDSWKGTVSYAERQDRLGTRY